jgi:UDP-N-acetylenolpyruvoylglucosamine reductase
MVELEPNAPLARLTTVRTGGGAEWLARASSRRELAEALAWAREHDRPVRVIGSGSNLLVADAGVRGLVVKLEGELTRIERDGDGLRCGGGARLPRIAARTAELGLSGIEFGVSIPGTVGGAVRMNANAYDGSLGSVLDWVEIVTADGIERRAPPELGFEYRRSNLADTDVVARVRFALEPAPPAQIRETIASMRARRHATQPKGIRTFGSTFKNPPGARSAGELLAAAGAAGLANGGARLSPTHANFVENTGSATTAEILALMAAGRALVSERFGVVLEPEVQLLGDIAFPW